MKNTSIFLSMIVLVFAAACGTEDPTTNTATEPTCPELTEGEVHLSAARSTPDEICIMLHHTTHECARTGDNRMHIYVVNDIVCENEMNGMNMMAPDFEPAMTMGMHKSSITTPVTLDVDADMPAHGHGLAQPAVLDTDDSTYFDINFQMPGAWVMELEFEAHTVTDETQPDAVEISDLQTIQFELNVAD